MTLEVNKGSRFEPSQRELYLATFIPKSDVIYRFAFSLTLNIKAASQLTERVFLQLSQEVQDNKARMSELSGKNSEEKIYSYLAAIIWRLFQKMKSKRTISPDNFPMVKILSQLDDEERFILMVTDIFDLKIPVVSDILQMDDISVRKKLVKCREHLLGS